MSNERAHWDRGQGNVNPLYLLTLFGRVKVEQDVRRRIMGFTNTVDTEMNHTVRDRP